MATIKVKNKKCIECGREDLPHFSKKRCKFCANKIYKLKQNKITKTKRLSETPQKSTEKDELVSYYQKAIKLSKKHPYSFETGSLITNISGVNIAHLFPKRKYKSVATNLDNFVLLTWDEHTEFDNLLDRMDFDRLKVKFPKSFQKLTEVLYKYQDILEEGKLKENLFSYLK